jgi:very-short-patch-repair endonuclease
MRHKFLKGYTPWNKGLTKENDIRLVRTEEYRKSMCGEGNTFYGKKHTLESRTKIKDNHADFSGVNHPFFGKHIWKDKKHPKGMLGKENKWGKHSNSEKDKIRIARAKQVLPVRDTKPEIKVQNLLRELEIEFLIHQFMHIEHGYQCDIFIPSMKLIIECDGDYWHGNPLRNKELDGRQKRQKEKDDLRTKELREQGYKVVRLWESDIKTINLNKLLEIIKDV